MTQSKKSTIRKSIISWLFKCNRHENPAINSKKCLSNDQIQYKENVQIPDRRQSYMYTPYHNKEYPCKSKIANDINTVDTTIARSATWQPSLSKQKNIVQYIPIRRTSRNYIENPEIQAVLDSIQNNDRSRIVEQKLHGN